MRRKDREVCDIKEIEEIISQCKTCHVAMVDNGEPYVVPLSYGYEISDKVLILYLHSAKEGRKIDIWKRNNKVCFEMSLEGEPVHPDTPCNSGYYFASVIGNGKIEFIEDPDEKCRALASMFKHQSGRSVTFNETLAKTVCVYKIIATDFVGKKKHKQED